MTNTIKFLFISLLFLSCSKPKPTKDQIVGIWRGQGGAIIELRGDNSAKVVNYPLILSHPDFKGTVDGIGAWKIIKEKNLSYYAVKVSIKSNKSRPELINGGIAIPLLVADYTSGDDVKTLFIWRGDPDSNRRYEFKKK